MPTSDPLQQWQVHLTQIGDIATVWRDYSGLGVTVGVYDDGVDFTHEDLAANYDATMHFIWRGVEQVPNQSAGHGTAVAGILAAVQGNGLGGSGVAHGVTFTSVRVDDGPQLTNYQLAALVHAASFDVMSNSWLRNNDFRASQSLAIPGSDGNSENLRYGYAVQSGRDGLGTIIVQAAGNDFATASGAALNVSRYTITVAGTDNQGRIHDYSNFGSAILVAAPAAGITTDVMGNLGVSGYNAPDALNYTYRFGGTSGATPVVSGVVALMLEANPGLGWRDVQNILAFSASQTGSAFGGAGTGFEVGAWQSVGGTQWNGGGAAVHASYGYGMVDAFAAVRMAEAWNVIFPTASTSANEATRVENYTGPGVAIPDAGGGSATITHRVAQRIGVETVYVTVEMTHADARQVTLALRAPDGTVIDLYADGSDATLMDDGFRWTFAVEGLRGTTAAGDWSLVVTDDVRGGAGQITDFDLQVFGTPFTNNDVYHFTDDFLALAAVEPERLMIRDRDNGVDWADFSAFEDRVVFPMDGNYGFRVDDLVNQTYTRWAHSLRGIENVYAGDGGDWITGSQFANAIWGRRGNDILRGGSGDDTIVGGEGSDTLWGGGGHDRLAGGSGTDRMIGGLLADDFVLRAHSGRDRIDDFEDNIDTLLLDDALWTGTKTAAQVVAQFATVVGGNVILTFETAVLNVRFVTNPNLLINDITII